MIEREVLSDPEATGTCNYHAYGLLRLVAAITVRTLEPGQVVQACAIGCGDSGQVTLVLGRFHQAWCVVLR